jgi:hypothetical protein
MPSHSKDIRHNEELNCIEFDLTQGQVGLIDYSSGWVLDKYNFCANLSRISKKNGDKKYYIQYWDGKKYPQLHQLLTDFPELPLQIDHLNGNGLDDRMCNLEVKDPSGNQRNREVTNPFGVRGIRYDEKRDCYQAQIYNNEGKHKTFSRSCKKYGKEEALRLCIEWRLKKEKEFGGYIVEQRNN